MVYSFELIRHANIRYRDAVCMLARCELNAMLRALSVYTEIREEKLGNSIFLTFECRELDSHELQYLSGHSSLALLAENEAGLLRPLAVQSSAYLSEDLPEVLKYKGKTAVPFTRMMINTASALSAFSPFSAPLLFFDPLCGRGTSCFCAAERGMNAVGLDCSKNDIHEAAEYFARYLKYHKLKHEVTKRSETIGALSVPVTDFTFADSKEHFTCGDVRRLSLCAADTASSPALFRKKRAHIIAADLPYGVQHAPYQGSGKPESLSLFLRRAVPVWKSVLAKGGVIALSFNTLTLPSEQVIRILAESGFRIYDDPGSENLRHEVEQAVVRDLVFAFNTEEESVL